MAVVLTTTAFPLLATIQLVPLLAAGLLLFRRHHRFAWPIALTTSLIELLLALMIYRGYDARLGGFQFVEQLTIRGPFQYHAAADGITVLFLLLTAFLTLLVVIYGKVRELADQGRFYRVVFAIQTASMSLLVTLDLLWFVVASSLQLLPIGYLLWRWAISGEKDKALIRYWQFMGVGVVLLLVGTLVLGWNHADHGPGGGWSFDLLQLQGLGVSDASRSVLFFLLFYGLAIRTPLFPLHGWLLPLAEHGNIAIAPVFLLGLKVGIYGMLRFLLPIAPQAVVEWQPHIIAFAVAGIFYAALLALLQDNIRRLLAFAVVSHTSVLIIGLFTLGKASFQGSILLSVNFGLGITGLVMMTGLVYLRTLTMSLHRLGGVVDRQPLIGINFQVPALSHVGMPGTPGFDSVHLVLEDAMHRFGALVTIAAALGNVVAAGFLLWAFQRAFLSPAASEVATSVPALRVERASLKESLIAATLLLVLLGSGFYFEPWLILIDRPSQALADLFLALPDAAIQGVEP